MNLKMLDRRGANTIIFNPLIKAKEVNILKGSQKDLYRIVAQYRRVETFDYRCKVDICILLPLSSAGREINSYLSTIFSKLNRRPSRSCPKYLRTLNKRLGVIDFNLEKAAECFSSIEPQSTSGKSRIALP